MEFRWPAFIALWTVLIGPIMGGPQDTPPAAHRKAPAAAAAKQVRTTAVPPPLRR